MATSNLTGTGEEWKAMTEEGGDYRPGRQDAVVAQARARIETLRKRGVQLRVLGRDGKPAAHRRFRLEQTRADFLWGDCLWGLDEMYRFNRHLTDEGRYWTHRFSSVLNAANALCYWTERPINDGPKTEDLQGDPQMNGFAWCVDWANAAGLAVKGHPLFWSIPKCVPEWVKRYDYATQMKFVEVRVRSIVARFKGKVKIWDAINEPLWEAAFKNLPQRDWPHVEPIENLVEYIAPVLNWAREEDPDAAFLVNDYGCEADPPNGAPVSKDGVKVTAALQRSRFVKLARALCDAGTPPDGLGLQSHTGRWLDPASQWAIYDEIAQAGLPVHVTEFGVSTTALVKSGMPQNEIDQLVAEYCAEYMTMAFGHPAIETFFFWGFMSMCTRWKHRSGHDVTPVYHKIREMIRNQWMTRLDLETDGDGVARFSGFYGDYSLRYALNEKTARGVGFRVARDDAMPLTLQLPLAAATSSAG